MPHILLTEGEANRIIAAPKSIQEDLTWSYNPDEAWAKSEISVSNDLGADVKMYANVNMKEPSKFSFSLVLSGNFRILGLDVNGAHANKHTDRQAWRPGTHKQRWTDRCRDRFAYTPEEEISQNVAEAFLQFCGECNLAFQGQVRPLPPRQMGLEEIT